VFLFFAIMAMQTLKPNGWPILHTTSFPELVVEKLRHEMAKEVKKGKILVEYMTKPAFWYQWIVRKFLVDGDYRGLLLFHGKGRGKTYTAVLLAESPEFRDKKKIIIGPKLSRIQFLREIAQATGKVKSDEEFEELSKERKRKLLKDLKNKYNFITLKSVNMKSLFDKHTALQETYDAKLASLLEHTTTLNDYLIIFDEIHEFASAVYNGSNNALSIFQKVVSAEKLKIVGMTGSPGVNDPYEMAIIYNMISGLIVDHGQKHYLFTDNPDLFHTTFVDVGNLAIKNHRKFQERIVGLTSYVPEISEASKDVPRKTPIMLHEIKMSPYEWKMYVDIREKEIEHEEHYYKFRSRVDVKFEPFRKPRGKAMTTFRVRSRLVSNYALPEYIDTAKYIPDEIPYLLTDDDINPAKNLKVRSPKFYHISQQIINRDREDGPIMVYSNFTTVEGIAILRRVLEFVGFKSFNKHITDNGELSDYKNFMEWTGDTSESVRATLLDVVRSRENVYGKLIRVILVSKSGGIGLDLKYIRKCIITEPHWNWALVDQVYSRIARLYSHSLLPPEKRVVDCEILCAVQPKGIDLQKVFGERETETTDLFLYNKAKRRQKVFESFFTAMEEVSVHCGVVDPREKCLRCLNKEPSKLFHGDMEKHIFLPSLCKS
jgi:hypothetical protein